MNYHKPTDTLDGFTNTGQTYAKWEIRKSETKLAIVDVLQDGTRKIHLLDDLPKLGSSQQNIETNQGTNVRVDFTRR